MFFAYSQAVCTLLSPEFNGPFAAFLPPLEVNGTIVAAATNNQHPGGFLLAVRTEQRPADAAEAEAEGYSRADLLRAFDGKDSQGAAMQVSALGLAHDPQFREKLKRTRCSMARWIGPATRSSY